MNQCEDRHEPKYKIIYKPANGQIYCHEWLVCEQCYKTKFHFGSEDMIKSIVPLTTTPN